MNMMMRAGIESVTRSVDIISEWLMTAKGSELPDVRDVLPLVPGHGQILTLLKLEGISVGATVVIGPGVL